MAGFAFPFVGLVYAVRNAEGAGEIVFWFLTFAGVGFFFAVCLLTMVRLARRFRTMNSNGTEAMAFVLSILAFFVFSERLNAALPRLAPLLQRGIVELSVIFKACG